MQQEPAFEYDTAFSRNLGWVTAEEQQQLRSKRVAIAGMGGVGGFHLLTLARLGVGAFTIADFDTFDLVNFNRQAGALMSNIGRPKAETMAQAALDINPGLKLSVFPEGMDPQDPAAFLEGADLYVDSLDFFAFEARRSVFAHCARHGIPAVTAAPLGMGAALLCFMPGGMTFEEYFRFEGHDEDEQALRFMLGLSPAGVHSRYLVDPSRVDLAGRRGPSTVMACQLCAGVAGSQALKILLGRGKIVAAPRGLVFDAYENRIRRTWRPGGNRNPVQRLSLAVGRRRLAALAQRPSPAPSPHTPVEQVLDTARWAPSGDNSQPWRFTVTGPDRCTIRGFDAREHDVYDMDGWPSQMSVGGLLETVRIAASGLGLRADIRRIDGSGRDLLFDVGLASSEETPDELYPYLRRRTVQRRPLSRRPLTLPEKSKLEEAVAPGFSVLWLEGKQRRRMAAVNSRTCKLRLTIPEAYETHRKAITWGTGSSEEGMPAGSLGLDPVTVRLTRTLMASWRRVDFANTYLGGTLIPRLELEVAPALACGAHFALLGHTAPRTVEDHLAAGAAMQRFWLTATSIGLQMQPNLAPLIFSSYAVNGRAFTTDRKGFEQAQEVSERLRALLPGRTLDRTVFLGRIGAGPPARARSMRLPMDRLLEP
ncbi:ThiF family adenylyltransferase [Kitasatospora sp. NPDC048540]|uniref:ThiF family adenylyltransferase n=1 Tax=Kitasatospora sp. NPDC048540 TaxID=3155634 RepID=UPI0033F16BC4